MNNHISYILAYQPYTQPTIPVPSVPTRIDHPTEGMTSLVNSSFNPDTALLPIRSDSFTSVVVPEGRWYSINIGKPLEGRAIINLSLPMDEIGIFLNMDSPDYERLKKNIEDSLNG